MKRAGDKYSYPLAGQIVSDLRECLTGKEVPNFEMTSVSGETYTMDNLKGKVIWMNFWSVHCGPCIAEIPLLNKLSRTYRDSTDLVMISMLHENADAYERLIRQTRAPGLPDRPALQPIAFPLISDAKTIIEKDFSFALNVYPTNVFIDKEGKFRTFETGGVISDESSVYLEEKLRNIIDGLLSTNVE
jgi:thiol-disulfide isomerase/thioredoxin